MRLSLATPSIHDDYDTICYWFLSFFQLKSKDDEIQSQSQLINQLKEQIAEQEEVH